MRWQRAWRPGGCRSEGGGKLYFETIIKISRGAWGAQSVKRPTLDFGSGRDLTVREFEPRIGPCTDLAEPAWNLSLSLPLSLPVSLSLSAPPLVVLSLSK